MISPRRFLCAFASFGLVFLQISSALRAEEVPNFVLLDTEGKAHEFHRANGRAVMLFFIGTGCPIVKKSAGKLLELKKRFGDDLTIWLVDSELDVDREAVRKEAGELGLSELPVLLDGKQAVALAFGVQRTAEAVVLDAKTHAIVYRGAVDDQLTEGAERPEPTHKYVDLALAAHFSGQAVETSRTTARGCLITLGEAADKAVSYEKEIAPILQTHCVQCHRPGDIGPFAFSSHQVAKRKARMMEEVVLAQRMPPWQADPHFGKFANDSQLSAVEMQTLLRWIKQGAPRGEGDDPLTANTAEAAEWPLGTPDYIIKPPTPQEIPATGVLDYRHVKMDSPVTGDAWLAAAVVRPGNRKVLHHALVYAKFEGSGKDPGASGIKIAGWAPGRRPAKLPEGTGLFLGKDAKLDIELHYTTVGTPESDQTEIGLYLLSEKPKLAYKSGMAVTASFTIPPNEPEAQTTAKFKFAKDSLLYSMTPHMHMRGSWMKYEALYPDGRREMLLSVPRYDFNWQNVYALAEPLRVPAGTEIICTGAFDNSPGNPSNPDPSKTVKWGPQSWDEMFIGYVGYAELPPQSVASAPASAAPVP